MLTIHPSLCRFVGLIQWTICDWRCPIFNLMPAALFQRIKERSLFNTTTLIYSRDYFTKACQCYVKKKKKKNHKIVNTTSSCVLSHHADFILTVRPRLFSPSTKSWHLVLEPDVSVIRSSSVVCIQSSLLASITVKTLQPHLSACSHGF